MCAACNLAESNAYCCLSSTEHSMQYSLTSQSVQKVHNSSTESFSYLLRRSLFFTLLPFILQFLCVIVLCFALYISLLHIFLSVCRCVVGWLGCVVWLFSSVFISKFCYFVYFTFLSLFFHGLETSFWCMLLFSLRLYAIYSERGCICLCYAFNLYLRSLSMRCYARLSLFVVHSVSVVGCFLCALLRLACIALPEHNNASQLTHTHSHSKLFLIYKLCIV